MNLEPKDCRWPWNRLYVHLDGDIKPCCYSLFNVGNIADRPDLEAIWNGAEMARLRGAIRDNRIDPLCAGAGCPYVQSRIPDDAVAAGRRFRGRIPSDVLDESTRKLAQMGHADAMFRVSYELYLRKDTVRALVWLERSARLGNVRALYLLGHVYLNWRWSPLTAWRGEQVLRRACEQDYGLAFSALGARLHQKRDYFDSFALFQKGAALNNPDCFYWLSEYHQHGIATPKDKAEADRLMHLAARRGVQAAIEKLQSTTADPGSVSGPAH